MGQGRKDNRNDRKGGQKKSAGFCGEGGLPVAGTSFRPGEKGRKRAGSNPDHHPPEGGEAGTIKTKRIGWGRLKVSDISFFYPDKTTGGGKHWQLKEAQGENCRPKGEKLRGRRAKWPEKVNLVLT